MVRCRLARCQKKRARRVEGGTQPAAWYRCAASQVWARVDCRGALMRRRIEMTPRAMPVRRLSARSLRRTSRGGRVRVRALSCVSCCGLRRIRKPNEQRCALWCPLLHRLRGALLLPSAHRSGCAGVLKRVRARGIECGRARSGLVLGACECDARERAPEFAHARDLSCVQEWLLLRIPAPRRRGTPARRPARARERPSSASAALAIR